MIKLTNATEEFKGKALLINPNHILTIFEEKIDDKVVTNIYSVTQQIWQVEESIDDIYSIINK